MLAATGLTDEAPEGGGVELSEQLEDMPIFSPGDSAQVPAAHVRLIPDMEGLRLLLRQMSKAACSIRNWAPAMETKNGTKDGTPLL